MLMNFPVQIKYGDGESQAAHERLRMNALRNQRVRFAVAPGEALEVTRAGRVLQLVAGDEVTMEDVSQPDQPAIVIMNRLVDRGHVLEQDETALRAFSTPADAEWCVARGGSISCARGILVEGEQLFESDVGGGRTRLFELVKLGRVVHRPPTATPAARRAG